MKTYKIILIHAIIFSLFLLNKETISAIDKEAGYRIKRKLVFYKLEDTVPIYTYVYQYDMENRLEKISRCYTSPDDCPVYTQFKYNSDNKKEYEITYGYANDSLGWVQQDSTYYSYENGNLTLAKTIFFTSQGFQLNKYEYENSKLKKIFTYSGYQFQRLTIFDYSGQFCSKETNYSDSLGLTIYDYILYYYQNNLLVKSETFNKNDERKQDINYTYDVDGNLIIEESVKIDSGIVKPLDYVYRYEYFNDNSINFLEKEPVKLYPNPVKDVLKIELNSVSSGTFRLYNSTGRFIKTSIVKYGMNAIHIGDLKPGVYFIHLLHKDGILTRKIIKE